MKKRYMEGIKPKPDRLKDAKKEDGSPVIDSVINMSDANYDKCTNSNWFKYGEDGKARLKTAAELKADADRLARDAALSLATEQKNEALNNLAVDVGGNSIQTRPSDEVTLRVFVSALDDGQVIDWRLSDNSVQEVSKEDLSAAYELGLMAAISIGAEWTSKIKDL